MKQIKDRNEKSNKGQKRNIWNYIFVESSCFTRTNELLLSIQAQNYNMIQATSLNSDNTAVDLNSIKQKRSSNLSFQSPTSKQDEIKFNNSQLTKIYQFLYKKCVTGAILPIKYNLGQKIVEKLSKLNKIGFSMESFTTDFPQFFKFSILVTGCVLAINSKQFRDFLKVP